MDTVNCVQAFAAALLLSRLVLVQATVMSGHPDDVTAEPNVWANFSCTVHGSYSVEWYKAGHPHPIRNDIKADSRSQIAGLEFKLPANSTSTSENKTTYFLQVLSKKTFNNSAFYCAAYEACLDCQETECRCGCIGRCYSRPAFLRVMNIVAAVTTTLHPTPTSMSSSRTETMPPEVATKTVTVTTTPTNCPTSAAVKAGSTSIQVGSSSSQAASAKAAILAGLGIVASILLL